MTVICLSNCPPKLRGDLTKWLMEVNTGVYVGNISARVREELWERITENIRSGQATMVFRAAGEQHMDFRVHNTSWKPVDYDGLKLMMRPNTKPHIGEAETALHEGFSKAAQIRKARQLQRAALKKDSSASYTVIDIETTGLNYNRDEIMELGALKIRDGMPEKEFTCFVHIENEIPLDVRALTGIRMELLKTALPLKEALKQFLDFIGTDRLLCWNSAFDMAFLQIGCNHCSLPIPRNKTEDALKLARRTLLNLTDYHLITVAKHFGIDAATVHRALPDCYLTYEVYTKLIEIQSGKHEEA